MTESEYKDQSERLSKYNDAKHIISIIENKRDKINAGIKSIECSCSRIDFDYLGEDFNKRLVIAIISFLNSEIESVRKSMEEI